MAAIFIMKDNNQLSFFDMFSDFETPAASADKPDEKAPEEVKPEEKKAVPAAEADETVDESDDVTADTAKDKPSAAAPKTAAKKKETRVAGPVRVQGTGWTFTYGEAGKSYDPKEVLKETFNAGFKGVVNGSYSIPKEKNVIYVSTVSQSGSDDSNAAPNVTVFMARKAVKFSPEDFPGYDEDEISVLDVTEKFVELYPDFKGCALKISSGVGSPVFDTVYALKKDSSGTVRIWSEDGIKEWTESEAALVFDKDVKLFKSETGVLFPSYQVSGKGATAIYMSAGDFGLANDTVKDVVEKYKLPFTLYLETFGQRMELTKDDFSGKEKVSSDEILDFLKPKYRAFSSGKRKIDIVYERSENIVAVALISGEKGAASIAAFPMSAITPGFARKGPAVIVAFPNSLTPRVENTDIGTFSGMQACDGTVTGLSFKMALPKIPARLLFMILTEFRKTREEEQMLQIYWNRKRKYYYVKRPEQVTGKASVKYFLKHSKDVLVLTVHSHNTMHAFFSSTDDNDEVYTGLFGVVGMIDQKYPEMAFRAGMEGAFKELGVEELFDFEAA